MPPDRRGDTNKMSRNDDRRFSQSLVFPRSPAVVGSPVIGGHDLDASRPSLGDDARYRPSDTPGSVDCQLRYGHTPGELSMNLSRLTVRAHSRRGIAAPHRSR